MIAPPRPISAPAARRALAGALVCLAAGACGHADAGASDSALSRDLTLASSAATSPVRATPVPFADTAVASRLPTPSPVAESPRPRPAARTRTAAAQTTTTPRRSATAPVADTPAPRPDAQATAAAPAPLAESHDAVPHDAAPATAPAATPAPAGHTFGAGTGMVLATAQPICSATNHAGDRFTASLREPVAAPDGGVLPAGTDVVLELTSVILGPAERGRVQLAARGISLGGYIHPLEAEVAWVDTTLERRPMTTAGGGGDAGKVGRGAMTGAILGRVFGGGAKGTVIGAATGAAVGAAGARQGTHYEGCLPKGTTVRMRLTGPLVVGT